MIAIYPYLEKVQKHDFRTYLHCCRVSTTSKFIGETLKLSSKELESLVKSAFLHDIGKIKISQKILNNPGKLSKSEWEALKQHPVYGEKYLINNYVSQIIIEGIIAHHERWDGKGYPNGLFGENIPLYGRIIAVADAIDAMAVYRPYRKQLEIKEAIKEIQDCSESQFDPYIVKKICSHPIKILEKEIYGFQEKIKNR